MKLLLASRLPPSLGGVETMGALIAKEWARDPAIQLKVITDVPGCPLTDQEYELVRQPSMTELDRLYKWADAVFFNHCYLRLSVPLLWRKKPYALSMSGTLETQPAATPLHKLKILLLKRLLARATVNIAACNHVRSGNGAPAIVIPNPYDSSVFNCREDEDRRWDFFFGGRVNQAAKGCLDLIEALASCSRQTGRALTLSVAGDGPDLATMKQRVFESGLTSQVRFLGVLQGPALAAEMRQHRVVVVPSRYHEPIGIICLEGIACGCVAVGSSGGGLGESVGPCGYTFPNGDVDALAAAMVASVSLDSWDRAALHRRAGQHLRQYHPEVVGAAYLAALRDAMAGKFPVS